MSPPGRPQGESLRPQAEGTPVSGPASAGPLRVRVARKTTEADGICSFELASAAGGALPAFTAGSHVDVQVP